ncbi:MAG: metallophosphoesterase [Pseudomonadota bacterium]
MTCPLFRRRRWPLSIVCLALAACDTTVALHAPAPAPLSGPTYTVYSAGDIADCRFSRARYTGAARTADLIAAGLAHTPQAAVLSLGDHTYPVGSAAEFNDCYAPTWGRFKERTYPTPGNHEYYSRGAAGYFDYFSDFGGPQRRGYFSVDLGAWHVISLNSNLAPEDHRIQLAWLRDDLTRHRRACTLAYWHAPLYSSGGHGDTTRMRDVWQTLHAAGAELVLSGHDHNYERFAPQDAFGKLDLAGGVRQFVVGTGGAFLTPLRWARPHSEARDNSGHGVLKLELRDNGYSWQFLPAPADHDAALAPPDSGTARCH